MDLAKRLERWLVDGSTNQSVLETVNGPIGVQILLLGTQHGLGAIWQIQSYLDGSQNFIYCIPPSIFV